MPTAPDDPLRARCDRLYEIQQLIYAEAGCEAGGPLHILLDDGNVRDVDLVACYQYLQAPDAEHVRGLGIALLHELTFLNEAQRYYWWSHAELHDIRRAERGRLVRTPNGYEVVIHDT